MKTSESHQVAIGMGIVAAAIVALGLGIPAYHHAKVKREWEATVYASQPPEVLTGEKGLADEAASNSEANAHAVAEIQRKAELASREQESRDRREQLELQRRQTEALEQLARSRNY